MEGPDAYGYVSAAQTTGEGAKALDRDIGKFRKDRG